MKYTAYLLGKEMDYRWTNFTGLIALGMTMLDSLQNQGGKVFMDNFYTSPTVFLDCSVINPMPAKVSHVTEYKNRT